MNGQKKLSLIIISILAIIVSSLDLSEAKELEANSISSSNERTNNNDSRERKFKPVPDKTSPRETRGSGSRGEPCEQIINTSLTLFHPLDRVGLTTKSHPDFILNLSEIPSGFLRFAIFDLEDSKPLIYRKIEVKEKGLLILSIPDNVPGMEIGKEYLFTVGLVCRENESMHDIAEQVYIKRLELPEYLSSNKAKQLEYFQEKNIWYDATFELFQNSNSLATRNSKLKKLLEQARLFNPELLSARLSLLNVSLDKNNSSYLKQKSIEIEPRI